MNLSELKQAFNEGDILWRVGRSGMTAKGVPWIMPLAYVDARAVMGRLDDFCGIANWSVAYSIHEHGIICKLSLKIEDEWVTKEDGSPETKVESFKGGISKALVRAASAWGIGRYLYDLGTQFAEIPQDGNKKNCQFKDKIKDKSGKESWHYWNPPKLPKWALPEN